MPNTFPSLAMAASLSTVLPPPHPTSSIVKCLSRDTYWSPQSVTLEWRTFMVHKISRPGHHVGFRHWRVIATTAATVNVAVATSIWSCDIIDPIKVVLGVNDIAQRPRERLRALTSESSRRQSLQAGAWFHPFNRV